MRIELYLHRETTSIVYLAARANETHCINRGLGKKFGARHPSTFPSFPPPHEITTFNITTNPTKTRSTAQTLVTQTI
jgi:hypothetical protein